MMYPPIKYFGGKGTKMKQILAAFPPEASYDFYLEAYGGSGSVLLNKPKKSIEVWNDLEQNLVALYETLNNPFLFNFFRKSAELTGYHESMRHKYIQALRFPTEYFPEWQRAFAFWYVNRSSHNGVGGFSATYGTVRRGMSKSTSDYLSAVEGLEDFHRRWLSVVVMSRDSLQLVPHLDRPRWMIYLDPPYVLETRSSGERYIVEADDDHHRKLVALLLRIRYAKVLVSGYDHSIYNPLVAAGWRKIQFQSPHSEKIETLWANYQEITDEGVFNATPNNLVATASATHDSF